MPQEKFVIRGGKNLSGTIRVKGAKNNALKVLAASLLSKELWTITRVPFVEDVLRTLELLRALGVEVSDTLSGGDIVTLRAKNIISTTLDTEVSKRIRASMVLTGPLLARMGEVVFPHPGGCVIGERPIDIFLKGYEALGASVELSKGFYHLRAKNGLRGSSIFFPVVSVTATETLMMAAVLARGTTMLKNAAMEPEVAALADFLNACGARISGHGTPHIAIEGVSELGGGTFQVIPDRIEAGSFALMAGATRSRLTVADCNPAHLDALISLLQDTGVEVEKTESSLTVDATGRKNLKARSIITHEYPGFVTDLQAPAAVFLTQLEGESRVFETIFEGRLNWTQELVRMGARITVADPHRIFVNGPAQLRGREITSPDIRAGMALIIAGLIAEGETTVHNIYQIDRGYEKIEERLRGIGADIQRVNA
ncbi:MAG: UDP-N-acetylglucosamine 1-carboxyvinyltransferase [bacterium]|nr:UDP-N-acetylglucosamine 1-carboxyvinyltransferase [bacterium]